MEDSMSDKLVKISRRNFFKKSATFLAFVPAATILGSGRFVSVAEAEVTDLKPVDLESPTAKALGYVHDAEKVDTEKFPKRAPEDTHDQFCDNCFFWTKGGLEVEGKEGEWGLCTLFPNQVVAAKGWCNSWVVKPGA